MTTYETECEKFSDYSLKYVKHLVKECESLSVPSAIEESIKKKLKHHVNTEKHEV